ncbi:asparaginase [Shimia marina]|uniref:L-asparaginase II n=1 Tax=Shimia marina TaxID=321267 RepID=A0A0P1EMY1_9RHOB|nr:asparaginase [Shimia marina]CUH51409.1 L-asparaginase II [Shimia marina]SFD49931.1 asparaginase [Shimia marina]
MTQAVPMTEIWRGDILESVHSGHAVVCRPDGEIVHAWGDPEAVVLPRSSSKMIQALPLVESGAADAAGLTTQHLALACASHNASKIHNDMVRDWLSHLGYADEDLICGPQEPRDIAVRDDLIRCNDPVCRVHNNCSGKHSGFLTLTKHLGADKNYVSMDHPVQKAVLTVHEELTGETSPGYGIDGCSAPNHASTLKGMARAMAFFAAAREGQGPRETAAARLRDAMATHPEYVAGEGRACTNLMRAMGHKVAIKTGAEAYFIAILPEQELGVALKIIDGGTRAAENAIAAILAKLGVLDPAHPEAAKYLDAPIRNWDGLQTGRMCASSALR